jgi:hypothetical protein
MRPPTSSDGIPSTSGGRKREPGVSNRIRSVQPEWCLALPIQQQTVLLLAARGPGGIADTHPCSDVQRAYRASMWNSPRYGRELQWGEVSVADDFMSLSLFSDDHQWGVVVNQFFQRVDDLSHHFLMHLFGGIEILGYKHPDPRFRGRWAKFYQRAAAAMHMKGETEAEMDARLSDADQAGQA